jgi:hypothetical protein
MRAPRSSKPYRTLTRSRRLLRYLVSTATGALSLLFGLGSAHAEGAPLAELHVWAGNESGNSSTLGLRSVEAAFWPTEHDRVGVRYDNSLSQDNAQLARQGIDAEAYFISYMHDFDGRFLLSGEVGQRSLPAGEDQTIYKGEGVYLRDNRAAKLGLQVSETDGVTTDYTDTVVYGAYNFPAGRDWRIEPQLYLSQTGAAEDSEWRAAAYVEYNAPQKWQLGLGAGYGEIDSDLPNTSGEVLNAHARLSAPIHDHRIHFQVRYEESPASSFTVALIGISFRFQRT